MGSDAEVVLGVIRAVDERDGERLMELFDDEVQLHDAASLPYGGVVEGKRSIREQIETAPEKTWLGTWDPVQPTEAERRMDPRVLAENDGEVVVLYHQRALAPNGERFDSPVMASTRSGTGSSPARRCSTTTPRRSTPSSSAPARPV